ncbi:flagellar basal body P-ring protein FlgI [Oligoflexus tunisiensis]|uniref:flagellar basal body P-ring protein FlgI n=1 Tax=Oligoflexus tunisiensis TaxID=708132 RepID=UPI000AE52B2F|nr:flagellar basal body P-ring protein FlgI [Oligoflexus tunisiensis]
MKKMLLFLQLVMLAVTMPVAMGQAVRIKDLANLRGDRTNSLIGFGLVVGLNQTGDSPESLTTNKAMVTLLSRLGMTPDNPQVATQSAAAVIVTAELPAFANIGDRIDVRLSTVADATSLAGGTLLMTHLRAGDGEVYVVAEGAIVVGQASGEGARILTVARIADGGTIEKEFAPALVKNNAIDLNLRQPDFTTSARVSHTINQHFRMFIAKSVNAAHVTVQVPDEYQTKLTSFIAEIEGLTVEPDQKAIVIVNERTGTVVMGGDVKISDVVVSHNGLSIEVGSGKNAKKESVVPVQGTTIADLVKSLNQMGVKPEDLVSILQSLHASGALKADIKLL